MDPLALRKKAADVIAYYLAYIDRQRTDRGFHEVSSRQLPALRREVVQLGLVAQHDSALELTELGQKTLLTVSFLESMTSAPTGR